MVVAGICQAKSVAAEQTIRADGGKVTIQAEPKTCTRIVIRTALANLKDVGAIPEAWLHRDTVRKSVGSLAQTCMQETSIEPLVSNWEPWPPMREKLQVEPRHTLRSLPGAPVACCVVLEAGAAAFDFKPEFGQARVRLRICFPALLSDGPCTQELGDKSRQLRNISEGMRGKIVLESSLASLHTFADASQESVELGSDQASASRLRTLGVASCD